MQSVNHFFQQILAIQQMLIYAIKGFFSSQKHKFSISRLHTAFSTECSVGIEILALGSRKNLLRYKITKCWISKYVSNVLGPTRNSFKKPMADRPNVSFQQRLPHLGLEHISGTIWKS